jgi:GntR family transcriptional repressor for pyruvate dehydrogenase complex
VSDQVFEQLRDLIFRGYFKPGEQLLSEGDLATRMGVSRPTVREAINKLAAVGLLEQRHGQGTFVNTPAAALESNPLAALMRNEETGIADLLEVRLGFECHAASLAARRATEEDLMELRRCHERMHANVSDHSLCSFADLSFHMAIAFATKNLVQIHVMKNIHDLLLFGIQESQHKLYLDPRNMEGILDQHLEILDAVVGREPEKAHDAMRVHIQFVLNHLGESRRV